MKRYFLGLIIFVAAAATLASCNEERIKYSGPAYVMFADTLNVCPVQQTNEPVGITVAATTTSKYDRTFGVEVVADGSTAIYGHHYTLESSTVTIKAGERTTQVNVIGNYDNIEPDDELGFSLRLASLDDVEWDLYGLQTKVRLDKICPFNIEDFTGYALVTSQFHAQYGGSWDPYLIHTELVEDEENTILLKNFYYEGYDVKIKLDPSDILDPKAELVGEQAIADTREPFNWIYGDGIILAQSYAGLTSLYNSCDRFVILYLLLRIEKEGTVGAFGHAVEWISDEEAQDYL